MVAAHLTGDGFLDLAVAEWNSDQVSVLLNKGNGTFMAPVSSYPVGVVPVSLVAVDFGNGHIDLATANENSADVSVLLGDGDGTFQPQSRFGVGSSPVALVAADLNGDNVQPGRCQPGFQRYLRAPGTRRRHIPGPVDEPGGK